jgi:polyphenol oxidase
MRLHCLYCDNALYYPGQKYPLEVHNGWFFLPWHRMFMYWHERILSKLLDDDTFALPYWAWDNSMDVKPVPNQMPDIYAKETSPLYDAARNNCSFPPFLVDLDTIGGCTTKTSDFIRIQNDRLQYTQLVIGAQTPALFYGMPYYFGDFGGGGPGTFEDQPHGTVHAWMGKPDAAPPLHPFDDMGNFGRAAYDPIFYAHHSNVDRLWSLWKQIPGGKRTHPTHPAFLNSVFTFYDENANLVKMNVSQSLDSDLLGYNFESLPTPWMTNGVQAGRENSIPLCNPLSKTATNSLISKTPKHKASDVLLGEPMTFKVTRPSKSKSGVEVLEISGLHIPNNTIQAHWKAYFFYPNVSFLTGAACPEFAGTYNFIPHVGQAEYNPKRVWRVAVGPKLLQLGKDWVKSLVVTIVQTGQPLQALTFDNAKIICDRSPTVTL